MPLPSEPVAVVDKKMLYMAKNDSADSDGGEVIRNRNSFYLYFQSSSSILYLFGSDNDSRGSNDNDNNTVSNSCTNFSPDYSYKEHIL